MNNTTKDRYSISADELDARMQAQSKYHDEPVKRAVAVLEMALDKVMTGLGVNVEMGDIKAQQDSLGIIITEETREAMAGLQGFFVFLSRKGDMNPYCWIGQAVLKSDGRCYVDIQYFMDNRLEEVGGERIIK